ncbi:MAG: hypothetical protein JSS82_13350 [Bacteroidetes bacterium]|nr:hypothetical protein [Bacteroidota bacterium]
METNIKANEDTGEVSFTAMPLSSNQLAKLYGISRKTLYKWMAPFCEEIGQKNGRFFTTAQVKTIVQKLGMPSETIKG